MTERLKSVGNDVNDSTGACAGTVASGRGGALAAQTVSKRKPGYDVTPSGRGGGKATTSVNMRNPCDLVGTVNVGALKGRNVRNGNKRMTDVKQNVRVATWNVGSMSGKSAEVVEVIHRRRVDVCCVQETRWKNSGARIISGKESEYKFYWQGNKQGNAGVGIFVDRKWIDSIVDVKRVNERIIAIKLIIGARLLNVVSAYAPQSGRSNEEKDDFWDKLIALTSSISGGEVILLGGDLNGHVGSRSDDYVGVHGGFSFGTRNVEGERILEFGDAMEMVVCNTLFKKEDKKLVTYESGGVSSTIDYLLMRKCDKRMVTNVKVIAGEEVVSQHRLLVGDYKIEGMR
jgi:hypothetical protein